MSSRIDQPTTWRLNRSITTARNSQPSSVAMYVMSPTQTLSGSLTVNSRFSTLGEIGRSRRLSVATLKRRLPRARMSCCWRRRVFDPDADTGLPHPVTAQPKCPQ